jgi:hypothetical protein
MVIFLSGMVLALATLMTTETYVVRLASATYMLTNLLNYHPIFAGQL